MTIPFLSYFKRGKGNGAVKEKPAAPAKPVLPPLEKPSSERFSKTVMPNATRTLPPQDPFEMAARSTALGGQMPGATAVAPAPVVPRTISFSPLAPAMSARDLPPAIALALEPTVERVISLDLGDVLTEVPPGYVKPIESIDVTRRILLKASEVERGMASGKPTVSLATVYQQVPEIFLRQVDESDASQLKLPFKKVLDGFAKMQVRSDQERASAVPQVETPFLKVTLEDNQKFGTTTEQLETTDLPPVRVQPPTAEAFAAAEPEAAADARLKMAPAPSTNGHTPQTPTRIPFKFSPNGTDAPAPESVPASSGPSVPNLPSPLAPVPNVGGAFAPRPEATSSGQASVASTSAPVRIPFKMAPAPDEEAKPKPEPWLTKESLAPSSDKPAATALVSETARVTEVKIALPLLPILQSLPPMQLTGDPGCVPPDVRLELPFSLIEPQLASGRISVTAKVFEVSLPISFRGLFQAGPGAVDVSLPLQEVLKNLPAASLRMRDDQEEQDAGQNFATPFSAKAEEDAKRFNVPPTPVAKPVAEAAKSEAVAAGVSPAIENKAAEAVAAAAPAAVETKIADTAPATEEKGSDRPLRTPLQVALDTDEKLDAKGVVALVNKIPGVKSCSLLFGDGLSLAGSLPVELDTDGICAMAPSLMQRIENHLVDTKLGLLRGMTLSCAKGAITFYMHENLCLAALHADLDLPGETREKLSRIVHELSRKYSHPV
jgi:predicted regulator of Ras-like GTPase activity (Roadblock/LC7/MglB family)